MVKIFELTPRVNKSNKQINISLPRRKLSKETLANIDGGKKMRFRLEGFK